MKIFWKNAPQKLMMMVKTSKDKKIDCIWKFIFFVDIPTMHIIQY